MSGGIRVMPFEGKIEDQDRKINLQKLYVTGVPRGTSRRALDVLNTGVYVASATETAEAGSTDSVIKVTGHSILKGDIIRFISTSNSINELEVSVNEVIDADNVELAGVLSADVEAGDTFSVLRPITPTYSSAGALLASQTFIKDGVPVVVTEDTSVPANNIPFPVKLVDVTGDVNITANDLNVQLSHSAANPDSVQIGDGTETVSINAGEMQVADDTARTSLSNIEGQLPATLGQKAMAASLAVVIASDQSPLNINDISGTISLPTGAATAANQATGNASLSSIDGKLTSSNTLLGTIDVDTGNIATSVSTINGKLPGTLGQKASANSLATVLSTEQEAILTGIQTAVELLDNAVNGTTLNVTIADVGTVATEATLSAMSAKLPASLGQKSSDNSMSVVQATEGVVAFQNYDFSTGSVTDSAYTELIADIGATPGRKVHIMMQTGSPIILAIGAVAAETDYLVIPPGGLEGAVLPVNIPANSRISMKSANTGVTISSGRIFINIMG